MSCDAHARTARGARARGGGCQISYSTISTVVILMIDLNDTKSVTQRNPNEQTDDDVVTCFVRSVRTDGGERLELCGLNVSRSRSDGTSAFVNPPKTA